MNDILVVDRPADGVVRLRLNRPTVLNALNLALRRALADAFDAAEADERTRVVVIAGGERAFCAGADLNEYVDCGPPEISARNMGRLWDAIAGCSKPVIAAVRGHALGGGCELAMHADLIVAGASATFGQPEVKIGLMPGGGATQRLTRAIGKFHAMRLLLTGDSIPAGEACALGLVGEVVADEEVEERSLALARRLTAGPRLAQSLIKEAVIESMNGPLQSGLRLERRAFQMLFSSRDAHAGMAARLARQDPVFD